MLHGSFVFHFFLLADNFFLLQLLPALFQFLWSHHWIVGHRTLLPLCSCSCGNRALLVKQEMR